VAIVFKMDGPAVWSALHGNPGRRPNHRPAQTPFGVALALEVHLAVYFLGLVAVFFMMDGPAVLGALRGNPTGLR